MKNLLVLIIAALGIHCLSPKDMPTQTSPDKTIKKGTTFTIELPSNVATGKSWLFEQNIDQSHLELIDKKYVASQTDIDGQPGKDVFSFRALAVGKTNIHLVYDFPFDPEISQKALRQHFLIEITP